jgi:hypothetical protein
MVAGVKFLGERLQGCPEAASVASIPVLSNNALTVRFDRRCVIRHSCYSST